MQSKILAAMLLSGVALAGSAYAATYAANCRYDTADQVSSGLLPGTTDTTPGEHYRMRLDIDTDRRTVIWSGDSGYSGWGARRDYSRGRTWHHGDMWRAYDKDVFAFVVINERLVRFGTNTLNTDRSVAETEEYSLDLESGLFTDLGGRRWDCQKAGNQFQ